MTIEMMNLIKSAKDFKRDCVGKTWRNGPLIDISSSTIWGEDDGSLTDLHHTVLSTENGQTWLGFWVEVDPTNDKIVDIDLTSVDMQEEGENMIDCVNIEEI